jgi:hypothetical protein
MKNVRPKKYCTTRGRHARLGNAGLVGEEQKTVTQKLKQENIL